MSKALELSPTQALLWYRLADAIEAYPYLYDQSEWGRQTDCGTVACLAGWACALSGWHPTLMEGQSINGRMSWYYVGSKWGRLAHLSTHKAADVAADLLGLNDDEAESAFDYKSRWSPDQLREVARGETTPTMEWGFSQ